MNTTEGICGRTRERKAQNISVESSEGKVLLRITLSRWNDTTETGLKKTGRFCLIWIWVGFSENGNELSGSVKYGVVSYSFSDCEILKRGSASRV